MRILQVAPGYYPRVGGVEYVVKSVSERLVKSGHEVIVLAGEPDVGKPCEEEVNGVRVIRWPTWSPSGAYHFPRKKIDLGEILKELARQVNLLKFWHISLQVKRSRLKPYQEEDDKYST